MQQISSIDNSANTVSFQKDKKEKKKDHFGRNLTIAAGTGAGLGLLGTKSVDMLVKAADNGIKEGVPRKFKALLILTPSLFFSELYLAGRAIKYREDKDHLGRNSLITTGVGAVAGWFSAKKILDFVSKNIDVTDVEESRKNNILEASKNITKGVKVGVALQGAVGLTFLYLVGKGLYDKVKGEKTFGVEKNS